MMVNKSIKLSVAVIICFEGGIVKVLHTSAFLCIASPFLIMDGLCPRTLLSVGLKSGIKRYNL